MNSAETSLLHLLQMLQESHGSDNENNGEQHEDNAAKYFKSEVIPFVTDNEVKENLIDIFYDAIDGKLTLEKFFDTLNKTLLTETPNSIRIKNLHCRAALKQSEKILEHIRKYTKALTQPANEVGSDDLSQRFHNEGLFTSPIFIQILSQIDTVMKSPESPSSEILIDPTKSGIEVGKCLELLQYPLDKMSDVWAGFCTVALLTEGGKIKIVIRPENKQVSTLLAVFEQRISEISFDQKNSQDFLEIFAKEVQYASVRILLQQLSKDTEVLPDADLLITPLQVGVNQNTHSYALGYLAINILEVTDQLQEQKLSNLVEDSKFPAFKINNVLHRMFRKPYPRRIRTALEDKLKEIDHRLE